MYVSRSLWGGPGVFAFATSLREECSKVCSVAHLPRIAVCAGVGVCSRNALPAEHFSRTNGTMLCLALRQKGTPSQGRTMHFYTICLAPSLDAHLQRSALRLTVEESQRLDVCSAQLKHAKVDTATKLSARTSTTERCQCDTHARRLDEKGPCTLPDKSSQPADVPASLQPRAEKAAQRCRALQAWPDKSLQRIARSCTYA